MKGDAKFTPSLPENESVIVEHLVDETEIVIVFHLLMWA